MPTLWRGLDGYAPGAPRAAADEFPGLARAAEVDRRMALRLLAASMALAGAAGCDRPAPGPLLSQPRNEPGHVAGRPLLFATSLDQNGLGFGALVETIDGRPAKIEGNPLHPASLGGSNVAAQADLLALYDPDRSRSPRLGGRAVSWTAARRQLAAWRRTLGDGSGLAILLEPTSSPTTQRLVEAVRVALPAARWFAYRPIDDESAYAGAQAAFGRPLALVPRLDRVDTVLALGADPLGPGPAQVRLALDYIQRRRRGLDEDALPTLLVAESVPTLTGARADRRLPMGPHEITALAWGVASALGMNGGGGHPLAAEIAALLERAGPDALVLAGREQPPEVHTLAHWMNERLGAIGRTAFLIEPVMALVAEPVDELARALAAGEVRHLLVLGANPAHNAPVDLGLAHLVRRVPFSLHLGHHFDETARLARWHIPELHGLERWGDLRAFDGTAGVVQPATVPLAPGSSIVELLALLAGERADARAAVRATWAAEIPSDEAWLRAVEAGVIPGSAPAPVAATARPPTLPPPATTRPGLQLVFRPDPSLWDGRFANNAWLQELPDPVTKLVWGNAALLAPTTAARLGLENGAMVELDTGERRLAAPVWILPGMAADTVGLPLGYGRLHAGRVGNSIGVDAYALRTAALPWAMPVALRPTGERSELVDVEWHHEVVDAAAVRYVDPESPVVPREEPFGPAFYPEHQRTGDQQWGMVIDLDACIGCATCTIACQAENNIPVVGPEQVRNGREMHWIRVDRFHAGSPDAPLTAFQPVPCMHCETAPCEPVCPVAATVHSSEGLNQMVYNRCIGTRTCSNNCPYKVRRFNWFDFHEPNRTPDIPEEVHNPRVSLRARGVMEKCTYCVQRIEAARTSDMPGATLMTACQQACPTNAIVFGDLADPTSAVARLRASPRNYQLLGDLNLAPRTTYLARVAPKSVADG